MPGSSRPKSTQSKGSHSSPPENELDQLKKDCENAQPSKNNVRKNFVKMNVNQAYKPRMRGAAFTNKIMAKKTNSLAAKARFAKRMNLEKIKNRDQVNAYGGLGKVGLDYEHKKEPGNGDYQIPAFSAKLAHFAVPVKEADEDSA